MYAYTEGTLLKRSVVSPNKMLGFFVYNIVTVSMHTYICIFSQRFCDVSY